ncbi:DUF934 domain-containing protein [Roseibium polysiphoniae]|nr:DUF934 domain-containing protein [Roseibium polysiphoniae]
MTAAEFEVGSGELYVTGMQGMTRTPDQSDPGIEGRETDMTKIFSNGQFFDEDWRTLEAEDVKPNEGNLLVPFERFLSDAETFASAGGRIAVLVGAGDEVEKLKDHLGSLAHIAVEFPKFTDGRGFSAARILREQMGYTGDIRAIGDYILDQVPLMRRCGVSSFQITKPEVLKALADGEWPEVTKYLQPVGTVEEVPAGTRPWARQSLREVSQAAE